MAGRPTKYTLRRVEVILQAIRDGNSHTCAAGLAGLDRGTFENWVANNSTFSTAVKAADAAAESFFVSKVRTASELPQHWTAAMTWLERRRHEDWGKKDATAKPDDDDLALISRVVQVLQQEKK